MLVKPQFNRSAQDILRDRYLWKDSNGQPKETPEQMLVRVATHVASAEKTTALQYKWADEYYDIMAKLLFMKSLQGGILAASCFNVSSDLNIDLNNDANLSYQDPQCKGIYEEAAAIDPEIVRQNPATLKVLLAAAEQIPDSRHRREFLLTCSHAGMEPTA